MNPKTFPVKAIGDGVKYKSVYSSVVSVKTNAPPVGPVPLDAPDLTVEVASTSLTVFWDPVANAERYSFSYKLVNETTWTNVNVETNLGYSIEGLEQNTEYDVRLEAIGDGLIYKNSEPTAARTVKARQNLETPSASISATTPAVLDPDAGFFEELFDELEEDDFDLLAANFDA